MFSFRAINLNLKIKVVQTTKNIKESSKEEFPCKIPLSIKISLITPKIKTLRANKKNIASLFLSLNFLYAKYALYPSGRTKCIAHIDWTKDQVAGFLNTKNSIGINELNTK
jgi:hypothetical protein